MDGRTKGQNEIFYSRYLGDRVAAVAGWNRILINNLRRKEFGNYFFGERKESKYGTTSNVGK
jgi:hypothetical protein